jgi:hypothetical protein
MAFKDRDPYIDLNGTWLDTGREVHITHSGGTVTAKHKSPQKCEHQDGSGVVTYFEKDFHGSFIQNKLDGEVTLCFWGTGWACGPGPHELPVKMRATSDGSQLLACYRDGHNKLQRFTVERAYTLVEMKFRVFVPAPAVCVLPRVGAAGERLVTGVLLPAPLDPVFKVDGRDFAYASGTHRAAQRVVASVDPLLPSAIIDGPDRDFDESNEYQAMQAHHVEGKPWWWWDINEDGGPLHTETLEPSGENSAVSVTRTGTNEAEIKLHLNAGVPARSPVRQLSFHIKAEISVHIRQEQGKTAQYSVTGSHTGFPAYEIYLNGNRVYEHDPVKDQDSPWSLGRLDHEVPQSYANWRDLPPWPQELLRPDPDQGDDLCQGLPEVHLSSGGTSGGRLSP